MQTEASSPTATRPKEVSATLQRICDLSEETYYNPYKLFEWPDSLPEEQWWMSQELVSTAGTRFEKELTEAQQMALSKWESVHFYSLNVHGIRELLLEVVSRVQMPEYDQESEFFHHFIGEENDHMWFFATFCHKYGGKIYPSKKLPFSIGETSSNVETFLVFSRILIFEEIVDYFNIRMGRDESLHPIIRQVNQIHHQDESRHIAFGREIVRQLFEHMTEEESEEAVASAKEYVRRFLVASVESLYSPTVYRDAGLPEPYKMRNELLADPARRKYNRKIIKRTQDYFVKIGVLEDGDIFHVD